MSPAVQLSPAVKLSPAVQWGLQSGLKVGLIGVMHVWFSTMTSMPRETWGLMQTFFGAAMIFFAGWAGLKAFAATKKLSQAAMAGAVSGALGVGLFTLALFVFAFVWTNRLVQFPFATEDLAKAGKTVVEYLSAEGAMRNLWAQSLGSILAMVPMAAGFGALGGLVVRSVEDIKEPSK
jgi:hypothetical protein